MGEAMNLITRSFSKRGWVEATAEELSELFPPHIVEALRKKHGDGLALYSFGVITWEPGCPVFQALGQDWLKLSWDDPIWESAARFDEHCRGLEINRERLDKYVGAAK